MQQLKSSFTIAINWNIYQSKRSIQTPYPYLGFLIDPSFQRVDRLFVLSFENKHDRTVHTRYHLPKAEIKGYNDMINEPKIFDQPVKKNLRTYNIQKIAAGQEDDYTTVYLLDYNYFNKYYKMVLMDLSQQQAFDADPRSIQQINSTGNLTREGNATMFFIIEEAKETILDFSQGTVIVL